MFGFCKRSLLAFRGVVSLGRSSVQVYGFCIRRSFTTKRSSHSHSLAQSVSAPASTSASAAPTIGDIPLHVTAWIDNIAKNAVGGLSTVGPELITLEPLLRYATTLSNSSLFQALSAPPPPPLFDLTHWFFCQPYTFTSALSSDGYDSSFQPPNPFHMRMFAGASVTFHRLLRPPTVGQYLWRKWGLKQKPEVKIGKRGAMVITQVHNEWSVSEEKQSQPRLFATETWNYIYRDSRLFSHSSSQSHSSSSSSSSSSSHEFAHTSHHHHSSPSELDFVFACPALTETLLFRYSALTFNAHRIHYDYSYAHTEGHGAPLVHGPLSASLLVAALNAQLQKARPKARIEAFQFRAVEPLKVNTKHVQVFGKWMGKESGYTDSDGHELVKLWLMAPNADGRLISHVEASARIGH